MPPAPFRNYITNVECHSNGDHGSPSNASRSFEGFSSAASTISILDHIRFARVDPFGPTRPAEFISFDVVLDGILYASAPIEGETVRGSKRKAGRATVRYEFRVSITGGGSLSLHETFSIEAGGTRSGFPGALEAQEEFEFELPVDVRSFDPTQVLTVEIFSRVSCSAFCDSPEQSTIVQGDVSDTVYFTGFKFFDADLNPLPKGTYSAIGEAGIDWTLSNLPEELSILDTERTQDNFTIRFTGPAEVADWSIKGSTDLETFTTDLTSLSTITETEPGTYQVVIDVSEQSENLYIRVER